MNRTQKDIVVKDLTARLAEAPLVMLADYRGVTVEEIDVIRRHLEANGVDYRVVKNSLTKLAIADTDKIVMEPMLKGMTGLVISGDDPIATAKIVREAIKPITKLEKFIIKGGFFEGDALDGPAIEKVADLPGKEELFTMLLRTVTEGPRQVLGVIQGPARDLVYLLKNYEGKLSGDGE